MACTRVGVLRSGWILDMFWREREPLGVINGLAAVVNQWFTQKIGDHWTRAFSFELFSNLKILIECSS